MESKNWKNSKISNSTYLHADIIHITLIDLKLIPMIVYIYRIGNMAKCCATIWVRTISTSCSGYLSAALLVLKRRITQLEKSIEGIACLSKSIIPHNLLKP